MEQDELLRRIVETLGSLDLPYLITGSIATILYGEPRFTNWTHRSEIDPSNA